MGELMLACTRRSPMSQMKNYLYLFVLPIALGGAAAAVAGGRGAAPQPRNPGGAKEIRGGAAASHPGEQPARPDALARLHLERRALAGRRNRPRPHQQRRHHRSRRRCPFPGKRQLRGEIAAKEADADFDDYLAVRLERGLAPQAGLPRAAPRRRRHRLRAPLPGPAAQHPAHLRSALLGGPRRAAGHLQGADAVRDLRDAACCATSRSATSKEIEINALLNRPQGGHIEVPEDMAPGELTVDARPDAGARAHARSRLAREQKMVERSELAAQPRAQGSTIPTTPSPAATSTRAAMPPMWQFRVDFKLPAYFWRKQRAEIAEQEFAAIEARHTYEAADVAIEAPHPRGLHAGRDGAQADRPLPEVGDSRGATGARILPGQLSRPARSISCRCFRIS